MVPGCVAAAQMFKRLEDLERKGPWYKVSVRSCELLYVNYVAGKRSCYSVPLPGGVYFAVLARREGASLLKAVPIASSLRPRVQQEFAIGGAENDSGSSVVLGERHLKKRKCKIVKFAIWDCWVFETDDFFEGCVP